MMTARATGKTAAALVFIWILAGAFALGETVRIEADPPARIQVRSKGKEIAAGESPLQASVSFFDKKRIYEITAQCAGYETREYALDFTEFQSLEKDAKKVGLLKLSLEKKIAARFVAPDPPDATIEVKDATGKAVAAPQKGSVAVTLSFVGSDAPFYLVKIARESYETREERFDMARLESFAADSTGVRAIGFELQSKDFGWMRQTALGYDLEKGLVARSKRSRAYKLDAESGGKTPSRVHELPESLGVRGLTVSPDGARLVFAEGVFDPAAQPKGKLPEPGETLLIKAANLKSITVTGGGISQLSSSNHRDVDPAFTADEGKNLLFASNLYRAAATDLLQISAVGRGGIQKIYQDSRGFAALHPTQGADGTIAFALQGNTEETRTQSEIWTTGGANKFDTFLTKGEQPSISPDGTRIAYIGADKNLHVINTDASKPIQLTTKAREIHDGFLAKLSPAERAVAEKTPDLVRPYATPTWTPDGRHIVFTSMEGLDSTGRPNEDIWSIPADGGTASQLTANGSADIFPAVAPDKKTIYFISNRGNRWAILRMDAPPHISGAQ